MAVLIEAEQGCEELYASAAEPTLIELPKKADAEKTEHFPLHPAPECLMMAARNEVQP